MNNGIYEEIELSDVLEIKGILSFLLITATDLETDHIHKILKPLPNYKKILKTYNQSFTYYIGVLGEYCLVHIQSDMGSVSRGGSLTSITHAIQDWQPKAVIMIGIAFGLFSDKQAIGDVLISEAIIPYDNKRVGEVETISRSPIPPSGSILLNRFKNIKDWSFKLPDGNDAKTIPGHILSGESLVDNLAFKKELIKKYPNAKGGEMEGAGVFAASSIYNKEWIIVKGICDYGENKGENKEAFQKLAIESATSLCLHAFSSRIAFKDLGFIPLDSHQVKKNQIIRK